MYLIGAGSYARDVMSVLPVGLISGVMDSNPQKEGSSFCNYKVEPFNIDVIKQRNLSVILCFSDEIIESKLDQYGITWFKTRGRSNRNIFMNKEISKQIIDELFYKYLFDFRLKMVLSTIDNAYGFRKKFYSDSNKKLVEIMQQGDEQKVSSYLQKFYPYETANVLYDDEYFDYRIGMQLAKKVINHKSTGYESYTLCDIACGHGQFIENLFDIGIECQGIDIAESRVDYCNKKGLNVALGCANKTDKNADYYDCVTCFECLEHVNDLKSTISEIHRILKKNGTAIITVPYITLCDCDEHVRLFDENKIYTVLNDNFELENMILIPYIYGDLFNNLFVVAKKR